MIMNLRNIAEVAHEVNRAYCQSIGDMTQQPWEDAPEWQKESALSGVQFINADPDCLPRHSHDNWLLDKLADGWKWGPEKDADKKEHPCLVDFDDLPREQRSKDFIYHGVVKTLLRLSGNI